MAKKQIKAKEMFKPYDANAVPDSMPFPKLVLVTTTKGEETAVPVLNKHQQSWILDVALRQIDLVNLVNKKDTKKFYDKVKTDTFDAKAFQHTVQPEDEVEEAGLSVLVATYKKDNPNWNKKKKITDKEEPEQEDERVGLLRGYTKAGWRWAIQKVISNKRTAEKSKSMKDAKDAGESVPVVAPELALSKLFGITASKGRNKFRQVRHDEIEEYSKTVEGPMNAGSKFRIAEAKMWVQEDHDSWDAMVDDEDVDWKERQMLVAGGFQHMVQIIHATGKFRPLVATMVTAWVDENGQLQLDWVEAVPEGIHVRQPFEKQYAKLSSDFINATYAWAEKPLQDYVAGRDASARPAPPVFPVTAEALDDMSPNAVAQTVTSFLVKSYHAVFGSEDIPWAAIASAPDEYYDSGNFDLAFSPKGLEELKSIQWHALAMTLASGTGEGTSGFFCKAVAGEEEAEAARLKQVEEEARLKREEEARLQQEADDARLKREEEVRLKREADDARLKQEEEARLKREADDARLKREEEARLKREVDGARLKREEEARLKREADDAHLKQEEEERARRSGGGKRKAEEQLIPEGAGALWRTGRACLSPEEAKLERERKLAASVGAKSKPSYEYVVKSPVKPKAKTRSRAGNSSAKAELELRGNLSRKLES
ncbi:hypothetical protein B0H13DRAFT_2564524 [Mycena leptocephala]|nr:hypothetical protein B0H13DRAFT_2564524 [Mycena leptocephala]